MDRLGERVDEVTMGYLRSLKERVIREQTMLATFLGLVAVKFELTPRDVIEDDGAIRRGETTKE